MSTSTGKTILMVDDEKSIGMIIEVNLGKQFNIVKLENGADAYDYLLGGNPVDAMIVDYFMPEMDGISFIKEVRKLDHLKRVPIIMLSGEASSNSKIDSLSAGADDYVTKPFNPKELELRLIKLMERN
ncbi:MAG: response regulator transcription factor [Schleiferiaceae bacterium]|nr:response regulator transcription factor [Schleiferiaceae bacterium]